MKQHTFHHLNPPRWFAISVIFYSLIMSVPSHSQTRVKAAPVADIELTLNSSIPATVISLRRVTVASQIAATVVEVPIKVGQIVFANQTIAKLDCTDNDLVLEQAKAELGTSQASLKLTKQQLKRLDQLRKNNHISEDLINQKQADLQSIKSRIKAKNIAIRINQNQVKKCDIRAPFKGVISSKDITIGDFSTPGKAVASIVDIDNVELEARVTVDNLQQIQITSQLVYTQQDQSFAVSIRTLLPVIDETTQSQLIRLSFDSTKPFPGSRGRLSWTLSGQILPPALLVFREKPGIFVVEKQNQETVARFVAIDNARQGQPIKINLPADTQVITDGRFGLSDAEVISIE